MAVFDLDNTLASTAHRQHFLERRPRDWDRFFAAAMFLAEGTVKNHVANVLAKLGARDRTQAALRGRALGLV